MKKVLFTLTALAALMSCSKDEIVESQPAQVIGFSNIFVDNSTRAAYDGSYKYDGTNGNLTQFHVYGTVTNTNSETANIFNKQLVESLLSFVMTASKTCASLTTHCMNFVYKNNAP